MSDTPEMMMTVDAVTGGMTMTGEIADVMTMTAITVHVTEMTIGGVIGIGRKTERTSATDTAAATTEGETTGTGKIGGETTRTDLEGKIKLATMSQRRTSVTMTSPARPQ
jgi:hypothetical protein